MIKIENLYFNFSNHFNLIIDRLEIKEGEIFVIIGPNGAGKSTLLNIIALFEKPKSGKIEIFGKELSKLSNHDKLELRRKMAFIFPIPYLLSDTVYNNIYLPLKLRNIRDDNQVDKILNFFKIKHLNNDHISLSQGEKQRVILARAFIANPRLVLLDEPFSNLDKQYKESLISDLYKIIKENKTTVIFVTQNHQEALALADTIAVMKDGRILQQGRPEEIFTKPGSKEIADFIGIETIVEGIIIKKEDNLCFIKVQDKILEAISEYNKAERVFVCIRAEDVIISKENLIDSARNHFKAKIINIEPWNLKYKLSLDCGFKLFAFLTKQSIENLNLECGKEVFASFKATAIHLIKRGEKI